MMQGKLIVLEGIDGSGKSTQFRELCSKLDENGAAFRKIVFPRYENPSSALVKMYLGGELGADPGDINPYAASTFYAVDRCASYITEWKEVYNNGGLILLDRYTTANAVHQGSKLTGEKMLDFFKWLYHFEFTLLELPRPDLVIYLDIDLKTALEHMSVRQAATNTSGDIHETNFNYLKNCLRAGKSAARYYGWKTVSCIRAGVVRDVNDIGKEIYSLVKEVL